GALVRVRNQGFAIGPLEEEVRVAARKEPGGCGTPAGSAKGRLVLGQDPRLADRCSHWCQRFDERVECGASAPWRDSGPLRERLGRPWTEDVQVSTCQLESSVARIDRGRRHGPDGRLSGALPSDQHLAGRRGVPQPIRVYAEPATRLAVGHRAAAQEAVQAGGEVLADAPAVVIVRQPPHYHTSLSWSDQSLSRPGAVTPSSLR